MKAYVIRWSCIYRHCCILSAMAEFNSKIKKDFTLNILSKKDKDYINEKIHNLVPESTSYKILLSGSEGYTASCVFKRIYISRLFMDGILTGRTDFSFINALKSSVGHELGHKNDYMPKSKIKRFLLNCAELLDGLFFKYVPYVSKEFKFYLWIWEVHADFYGCFIALNGSRTNQLMSIDFKISKKSGTICKDSYTHPSWEKRLKYIKFYNFDRRLILQVARDAGFSLNECLLENIILHYGTIVLH